MSINFDNFNKKFQVQSNLLKEFKYWNWSIRPKQVTIPSTVLSLKRPCESFAEMTKEESAELAEVIAFIENKLKERFEFDKINYLCLMMVDYHLHFHIIPRYETKKIVQDFEIEDVDYPRPADLLKGWVVSAENKEKLKSSLT